MVTQYIKGTTSVLAIKRSDVRLRVLLLNPRPFVLNLSYKGNKVIEPLNSTISITQTSLLKKSVQSNFQTPNI